MTADYKYSLLKWDNLRQPIQMQLSQKEKTISEFKSAFSKSIIKFEHFQKKDDPQSRCISQITDSETWLNKPLRIVLSEDLSWRNM